jgi:hypothetical protein
MVAFDYVLNKYGVDPAAPSPVPLSNFVDLGGF